VVVGATQRAVDQVVVNGHVIVKDGQHIRYAEALAGFKKTMNSGLLSP